MIAASSPPIPVFSVDAAAGNEVLSVTLSAQLPFAPAAT